MSTNYDLDLSTFEPLDPPTRLLLGPGPSPTHPRVSRALAAPTIGHLDPAFLAIMDQIQVLLRNVFGTRNRLTFPVSGTGSSGMEACMVNSLESGDRVVIAVNGVFGGRMADIARRLGCDVRLVEVPFGQAVDPADVATALAERPTKLVGCVHAETSTGVIQDVASIAEQAHRAGALCMVDCVTSLGGVPVEVDGWGVDLAYAGTQKCLGCPPGLAPVTFSERAVEVLKQRQTPVVSWYLDAGMLLNYWGEQRVYHHTAPVNMLYGLREALLVLHEEGLPQVFARHLRAQASLIAGLQAMGLRPWVAEALRLPPLTTVAVPDGVSDTELRRRLLLHCGIEVGGGLGMLAGKAFRVGLMGHGARLESVVSLLAAMDTVLSGLGRSVQVGVGAPAAVETWNQPSAAQSSPEV